MKDLSLYQALKVEDIRLISKASALLRKQVTGFTKYTDSYWRIKTEPDSGYYWINYLSGYVRVTRKCPTYLPQGRIIGALPLQFYRDAKEVI